MNLSAALSLALLSVALPAAAQTAAPAPAPKPLPSDIAANPAWPAAKNPADVDTIDHLIAALYDVISGPPTKPRDWDRMRSLFVPSGRLGVIRPDMPAKDGHPARTGDVVFLTPDIYIERNGPYFAKEGFFERGIANRTETFGNLTSVWTTYESRHTAADPKPFARGINSVQLIHAQGRYWIVSLVWDAEREGLVLPDKYLR